MIYKGTAVSQGLALGKAYILKNSQPEIPEISINESRIDEEIVSYRRMKDTAMRELDSIIKRRGGDDILSAQLMLLKDEFLDEEVISFIKKDLCDARTAVYKGYTKTAALFSASSDELLKERAYDIKDIMGRLLGAGVKEEKETDIPDGPFILVCEDLLPSDDIWDHASSVKAIVSRGGGTVSHSAIMARSYKIPMVSGVYGILDEAAPGDEIIVDAITGEVILRPDEPVKEAYLQRLEAYKADEKDNETYKDKEAVTRDGQKIDVLINIGADWKNELAYFPYCEGVGLFRTEFIFMRQDRMPSETEQFEVYKSILEAAGDKPVIIRTLDTGADKKLPYLGVPAEANPSLGRRGIRFCLKEKDLFKTQLRALLRASACGNLYIMIPMVTVPADMEDARELLNEAAAELTAQGIKVSDKIRLGMMIETPAAAVMADAFAEIADFASIGTNDLVQYIMAADRDNPAVSEYLRGDDRAVMRMIASVGEVFEKAGKWLGVCGEMASTEEGIKKLLKAGIRKISVSPGRLGRVKRYIINM
ncbi:MAG: phosphoenolpyruvate--protein phosphotransferase [Lachnospiraceae bacterium]|nr:phosphoenolpyruvate--protein phosphotransferase [Lachnospiraceae bacterium]